MFFDGGRRAEGVRGTGEHHVEGMGGAEKVAEGKEVTQKGRVGRGCRGRSRRHSKMQRLLV